MQDDESNYAEHNNPRGKGASPWVFVVAVGLSGILALGFFLLATVPLVTNGGRDAVRAEGEQLLGAMKNRVKAAFAKTGKCPTTLTGDISAGGCDCSPEELRGKYFRVRDAVVGNEFRARISCEPEADSPSNSSAWADFSWFRPESDVIGWN